MGVLTRSKEPAAASAMSSAQVAPQKPGRFANLRARLGKPSESAEVCPLNNTRFVAWALSILNGIACCCDGYSSSALADLWLVLCHSCKDRQPRVQTPLFVACGFSAVSPGVIAGSRSV